jgi:seryl-tRNA synthetase
LFWAIWGHQFVLGTWIWALLAAPFVAGMIVLGVKRSKKRKPYNTERAKIEAKHKEFAAEIEARKTKIEDQKTEIRGRAAAIVRQFKEQKKALRGIYEELSGDAGAFPA